MSQLSQEIPPSWAATKIRDIAHLINGDRGKNYPSRSSFVSSGVPFINAGHIIDGKLFLNDMNFISRADFEKLGSGKIDCGDILYCLRGSLGKAAIVDIKEGAIASSLVILRTTQTISNRYLHYFLVSPQGKELIEEFDNGSAQPNLSATSLAQFRIPLAPLPEQKRIADKLDSTLARGGGLPRPPRPPPGPAQTLPPIHPRRRHLRPPDRRLARHP
ncbi:MAG: restriction endonuclease subunit S [Uliginosibacterium sp.]|nr:restriction endonuclease subunit S [Uliginosibacterium sp.]